MASSFDISSSFISKEETYYTILEINRDVTSQEIKNAYKHLAIIRHPDKNLGNVAKACADFQKVFFFLFSFLPKSPSPPQRALPFNMTNPVFSASSSILYSLRPL